MADGKKEKVISKALRELKRSKMTQKSGIKLTKKCAKMTACTDQK